MLSDPLFIFNNETIAYDASGSFLGFLIQRYGQDAFLALQKNLDFKRTYGKSVEMLDKEWNSFLVALPVGDLQARTAVRLYSWDKAYTVCRCPQVGTMKTDYREKFRVFNVWRDPEENFRMYEGFEQEEPLESHWMDYRLLAAFASGRFDATDFKVRKQLAVSSLDEPGRYDMHRILFWIAVMKRDLTQAHEQMTAMAKLSGAGETMDDIRGQLLSHPTVGPAYLSALRLPRLDQIAVLRSLFQIDNAFGPPYIYAFQYSDVQSNAVQKWEFLRQFAAKTTGSSLLKQRLSLDFINELLRCQKYAEACVVIAECNDSWMQNAEGRIRLSRLREQLEFEEARFSGKGPVSTSIMLRAISDSSAEMIW